MKTSKFTEEQTAYALRQVEGGTSVAVGLSPTRYQRADLLSLESKVRSDGCQRVA